MAGGANAFNTLTAGLSGPNGYGFLDQPFNPSNLAQTPGYQFALQQGTQAVTDQATATGGVGGGNTLKALTQYGQGLASTTYQQQLQDYMAEQSQAINALQGASGLGESAAAGAGSIGQQAASNAGNFLTQGASAVAGGATGVTNALNSGASNYLLMSLLGNQGGGAAASYNAFAP